MLEAIESGRAYNSVSLSTGGGSDEDGEKLDPLESPRDDRARVRISEDRAMLAPGFKVTRRARAKDPPPALLLGLAQSQIAAEIGISQMHVSRLIRRSLEKIREEIAEESK